MAKDRTEYDRRYHARKHDENLARMRDYWHRNKDWLNPKRNAKKHAERERQRALAQQRRRILAQQFASDRP